MKLKFLVITLLMGLLSYSQNTISDAFSKSYTYEYNKDYNKAINSLSSLNIDKYTVALRLGWLHYLNGSYNKSKMFYNKAIAFNPKSIEARLGLVYPISAMQNWDEVIKVYNNILTINPHNNTANYRLALIYYSRKNWDKATFYSKNILKNFPFDYDANLLLGSTLIKNGKIKEAKKVLQTALEFSPQSKDVITLLTGL